MNIRFRSFLPFISRDNLKETDGRYQYVIRYHDMVICVCYQPPFLTHLHPNRASGISSEAVYVVKGEYRSKLVPYNSTAHEILYFNEQISKKENIRYDIVVKEKEFLLLKDRQGICNLDTAGPEGAFMLHFNPIDEQRVAEYTFINKNNNSVFNFEQQRILFTIEAGVSVNGVQIPILSRVILEPNVDYTIITNSNGRAVITYTHDAIVNEFNNISS